MKVQQAIKSYLDSNGIKYNYLQEKTGIETQRLYRVISGSAIMSADEFRAICIVLEKDPKDFFYSKKY